MKLVTPDLGLMGWMVISILVLALWLTALVSVLRNDFRDSTEKLIWVLVILFLPLLGSILYFAIGRSRKINQ